MNTQRRASLKAKLRLENLEDRITPVVMDGASMHLAVLVAHTNVKTDDAGLHSHISVKKDLKTEHRFHLDRYLNHSNHGIKIKPMIKVLLIQAPVVTIVPVTPDSSGVTTSTNPNGVGQGSSASSGDGGSTSNSNGDGYTTTEILEMNRTTPPPVVIIAR